MRIAASNIELSSRREHVVQNMQDTIKPFGLSSSFKTLESNKESEILRDTYARSDKDLELLDAESSGLYMNPGTYHEIQVEEPETLNESQGLSPMDMIHVHLLRLILKLAQDLGGKGWDSFSRNISEQLDSISNGNAGLYRSSNSYSLMSYEKESMQFSADGRAVTEDGRIIDFNVSFGMSREFAEYSELNLGAMGQLLMDPLVINVGDDVAEISDQSFYFDLNMDGNKENVKMPGLGSGFLAVDKNGDGTINDGSELFGAQTGDGFGELREYDEDGNGWIDENDESSWAALKVWIKDDKGHDELLTLKEADVGAIYLGEVGTEYTSYSSDLFKDGVNGVVRSSGVFLHENGKAGIVQHVDLAYS
ncbi:MAG: hypothetical protein K6G87_14970 [Butyrivibrio sp.]|uniref:hypothetical protein n=1 Tax=Butyrivibrio sp. TaxID=28121 RepID=UPI0025F666F6|nr:hypothetical protein [Butyrivibrio sp.]MCR5772520.1 hypothetical protein [Butyrivibrio sp.]